MHFVETTQNIGVHNPIKDMINNVFGVSSLHDNNKPYSSYEKASNNDEVSSERMNNAYVEFYELFNYGNQELY